MCKTRRCIYLDLTTLANDMYELRFSALSTEDKLEYRFYPVTAGQIQFRVKANNDAHIALTMEPQEGDPMYEVRFCTVFVCFLFFCSHPDLDCR